MTDTDGKHRSYNDKHATMVAEELDAMVERIEELIDYGVSEGYRALEHKLEEACGPVQNAAEAMRQYATGELVPHAHA